jgi:hypothetical protein
MKNGLYRSTVFCVLGLQQPNSEEEIMDHLSKIKVKEYFAKQMQRDFES